MLLMLWCYCTFTISIIKTNMSGNDMDYSIVHIQINFAHLWFTINVESKCHLWCFICSRKQGQTNLAKTLLAGWCNTVKFEEHSCTINHFCQTTYWALCVPECAYVCKSMSVFLCTVHVWVSVCVPATDSQEIDASSVVLSYSAAWRQFSSLPLCCCKYLLWPIRP